MNAAAMLVEFAEVVLSRCVALLSRGGVPCCCQCIVLFYSHAIQVHVSKITGGGRVMLLGGSTEPPDGFRIILCNTRAAPIHAAQEILNPCNAVHGSSRKPLDRFCVVMWQADSALIGHAQHTLRLNIVSDRAFNKFGNLFLGEREQLIVYLYFQDSSSFGQFHLTRRNTYGRKQEKAGQQDFCDACQHALCPPHSADTHIFGAGPN